MTNKIQKPSAQLFLLSNKENIKNLRSWIKLLTNPFKKKEYAPNCFHLSSILHKGTTDLLPDEKKDLLRIDFPTTVSGLYLKTDKDYEDEGCIVFSIDNHASFSFNTDNHSHPKHQKLFVGNN